MQMILFQICIYLLCCFLSNSLSAMRYTQYVHSNQQSFSTKHISCIKWKENAVSEKRHAEKPLIDVKKADQLISTVSMDMQQKKWLDYIVTSKRLKRKFKRTQSVHESIRNRMRNSIEHISISANVDVYMTLARSAHKNLNRRRKTQNYSSKNTEYVHSNRRTTSNYHEQERESENESEEIFFCKWQMDFFPLLFVSLHDYEFWLY